MSARNIILFLLAAVPLAIIFPLIEGVCIAGGHPPCYRIVVWVLCFCASALTLLYGRCYGQRHL